MVNLGANETIVSETLPRWLPKRVIRASPHLCLLRTPHQAAAASHLRNGLMSKSISKSQNVDLLLAGCKAFNISYKAGRWVRYRDTCLDTRYLEGKALLGSCGISVAVAYGACLLFTELHVPERGAASRTTKKGRV